MKKLFALAALLAATSSVHAMTIFACEPEWGALATAIAGDDAKVYTATSAQQDPHHVQARPSLISAIRRADLVACTGGGLEIGWLPVLLSRGNNPKVQHAPGLFLAADQVELLEKPTKLDRSEGDIHAEGNPHIQLDPRRLLTVAKALAQRLSDIDGAHAADYQKNLTVFEETWIADMDRWQQQAASLKGLPVVVHHRGWTYLLDWLGMERVAELEPKPGLPPTPAHLSELVGQVNSAKARLILYAGYNGDKPAKWLAAHTDACAVELPFTVGGDAAAKDLPSLFDDLVSRLTAALKECQHG